MQESTTTAGRSSPTTTPRQEHYVSSSRLFTQNAQQQADGPDYTSYRQRDELRLNALSAVNTPAVLIAHQPFDRPPPARRFRLLIA